MVSQIFREIFEQHTHLEARRGARRCRGEPCTLDIRIVSCGTSRMRRWACYSPQRLSGHRRYALRSSGQRWAAWRAFWTTRRIQPDFGGKERRVSVTSHTRHTSLCRRVNTEELSNHSPRVTKMASIIARIPENSSKFMSSMQCILVLVLSTLR